MPLTSAHPPATTPPRPHASGQGVQGAALLAARGLFAAALFAVPVSTALTNICALLGTGAWLLTDRPAQAWRVVQRERVAQIALGLFLALALSMLWSKGPLADQVNALGKYRKLLFIPIVASLFDDAVWRVRALAAMVLAMGLTLVLSTGAAATGFAFPVQIEFGYPNNAIVFKQHITQNWLMSLFAFFCLCQATWLSPGQAKPQRWRLAFALVAIWAMLDIFALVIGRTGQVTMLALVMLWCVLQGRTRIALAVIAALGLLIATLMATHSAFDARARLVIKEFHQTMQGKAEAGNSTGERLTFWTNSLQLIEDKPMVGHGLGSTQTVYRPLTEGQTGVRAMVAWNPHNEFLNLSVQVGVLGAAAFAALLWWIAARARACAMPVAALGQGLALLMLVSCLFNSSLWDFNEGHAFVLLTGLLLATPVRTGQDKVGGST